MLRLRNGLILALLVLLETGCTYVTHESVDGKFPGLRNAMHESPVICLLFVHGMGGYSSGDPGTLIAAIKSSLKLHAANDGEVRTLTPPDTQATLLREHLVDDAGHHLRIYTLNWEPIADAIKKRYLDYDFDPSLVATRQSFDELAMHDFMYGRAADVVIYAGVGKEKIQKCVLEALNIMRTDAEASVGQSGQYRYFIVSWSMGSKIVFDCLSGVNQATLQTPAQEADLKQVTERTDSVFMLANQLPLLSMANSSPATQPTTQPVPESVDKFLAIRNAGAATQRPISIVAVSDPNDLLSYPIAPWLKEHAAEFGNVDFADVSISVAHWSLYIPFVEGGGSTINPVRAHTGYGSDPEVIHLIIEGPGVKK